MVVLAVNDRETMGDRLQPGGLRRDANILADVGSVHDQRQAVERRVIEAEQEMTRRVRRYQ